MIRINPFRTTTFRSTPATLDSVAWGKINLDKNSSTLVFAALLILWSVAVGCASEKAKPESSNNQPAMTQSAQPAATGPTNAPTAPVLQAAGKPVHKKVARKIPATVT